MSRQPNIESAFCFVFRMFSVYLVHLLRDENKNNNFLASCPELLFVLFLGFAGQITDQQWGKHFACCFDEGSNCRQGKTIVHSYYYYHHYTNTLRPTF
jgi:hypothetical protein